MTADETPNTLRTIRRYAGTLPPQMLADALGWTIGRLIRAAAKHHIDLRMLAMKVRDDPPLPRDPEKLPPSPPRKPPEEKLGTQIGVRLRAADEQIIRTKAVERFTLPGRLMRQVIEGAIARGKVDELASASRSYRPGDAAMSGEGRES